MDRLSLRTIFLLVGLASVMTYHMLEESRPGYESDDTDYYDNDEDNYDPVTGEPLFHCIWYGNCGVNLINGKSKPSPCVYDGPAQPVINITHRTLLNIYCSHLLINQDIHNTKWGTLELNETTCCDIKQMESLVVELTALQSLLERCPSCWHNMKKLYCDMTCSPHQSKFVMVTRTENHTVAVADLWPFIPPLEGSDDDY